MEVHWRICPFSYYLMALLTCKCTGTYVVRSRCKLEEALKRRNTFSPGRICYLKTRKNNDGLCFCLSCRFNGSSSGLTLGHTILNMYLDILAPRCQQPFTVQRTSNASRHKLAVLQSPVGGATGGDDDMADGNSVICVTSARRSSHCLLLGYIFLLAKIPR